MGLAIPPSTAEARVVWRDDTLELTTCPVRALTPEVQATMDRFAHTHDVTVGLGVARFTRTRLPGPGAVDAQDARTMAELDYVRDLQNALLAADTKRPTVTR